jgi:DNA-binding transcriptional regulator GbsR (MarR family)
MKDAFMGKDDSELKGTNVLNEARKRLVESGGRASQDLGAGRIVGQILVYLYLQEKECSLDKISEELAVSKASASITARQLEQFGVVVKVWKENDRKIYYRSADNIASALQQGILSLVRRKLELFSEDLEDVMRLLNETQTKDIAWDRNYVFFQKRVARAKQLQQRMEKLINHPIIRFLGKK